jgi:hypothetical protein
MQVQHALAAARVGSQRVQKISARILRLILQSVLGGRFRGRRSAEFRCPAQFALQVAKRKLDHPLANRRFRFRFLPLALVVQRILRPSVNWPE